MLNTLNRSISKSAVGPVLLIWLIFMSLFGKCAAQGVSLGFTLPLTFTLTFTGCVFCCCFWICFAAYFCGQRWKNSNNLVLPPPNTSATQYSFNLQRHQCDLQDYPQSQTSERDSLPKATLYQGDAPPAYEEAVRMKTVSQAVDLPLGSGTIFVVP